MGKRKRLSHEELWDDSALIRSWDEALEEYRLYHSIHARGEKVEDVLRLAEEENSSLPAEENHERPEEESHEVAAGNSGKHEPLNGNLTVVEGALNADNIRTQPDTVIQDAQHQSHGSMPDLPSMPSNTAGNDPVLKNLMMSWYYAGYYSGLHEAQRGISKHTVQHQGSYGTGVGENAQPGTSSV